jgi:hypothetical protein
MTSIQEPRPGGGGGAPKPTFKTGACEEKCTFCRQPMFFSSVQGILVMFEWKKAKQCRRFDAEGTSGDNYYFLW